MGSEFAGIRVGVALLRCVPVVGGWSLCGRFGGFGGFVLSAIEGVPWECGVGPPAVGFVLASVTTLLRGTSGVQPRDSEQ